VTQKVVEKKTVKELLTAEEINRLQYVASQVSTSIKMLQSVMLIIKNIQNAYTDKEQLMNDLITVMVALKESYWDLKLLVWEIQEILEKLTK
jgi:hypothetical protein